MSLAGSIYHTLFPGSSTLTMFFMLAKVNLSLSVNNIVIIVLVTMATSYKIKGFLHFKQKNNNLPNCYPVSMASKFVNWILKGIHELIKCSKYEVSMFYTFPTI